MDCWQTLFSCSRSWRRRQLPRLQRPERSCENSTRYVAMLAKTRNPNAGSTSSFWAAISTTRVPKQTPTSGTDSALSAARPSRSRPASCSSSPEATASSASSPTDRAPRHDRPAGLVPLSHHPLSGNHRNAERLERRLHGSRNRHRRSRQRRSGRPGLRYAPDAGAHSRTDPANGEFVRPRRSSPESRPDRAPTVGTWASLPARRCTGFESPEATRCSRAT